ncbi:3-oxoacyl-[acyl-carrier-protein] synthase III C-terminal domain-containing protein [Rhodococcus sp. X156]|uniref:type III polyketide synthase n=1 Tax=Rhodococcus sp. X156 TaxID=2499145 RepID=UPI000FD86142|nr:3-oxoacyl-[acyl-carrier-protein] synthase III C-terminal domain-containing protein [Rhodococcus sp. X156]
MTTLTAAHGALPPHCYPQEQITETFAQLCLPDDRSRLLLNRFHESAHVSTRHLVLPLERYAGLDGFTAANNVFLQEAVDLGAQALLGALADSGLTPEDVDLIMSTTVTGIAVPSLDARMAAMVGLRPDVKRVPLMGLGCMAGASGVARLHDYLRGAPDEVAVLVSVELCSLTLQRGDASVANMVASGLFGDGAAAVVAVGAERATAHQGPQVVDSRSHLYPNTADAMGWDVGTTGLAIVLGAEVPELVDTYLGEDVRGLLAAHELKLEDVTRWISHPGGPKVLRAVQAALGLGDDALALTWHSLSTVGNMSSASVLHVLRDTLQQRPAGPGDRGVLMAMGPGFAAELVLLQW